MQINPTPLAIALAIILSAPSFGTHAAPHALGQRYVTLDPRQGAAQRNAHLPHVPMEGLWPTSATAGAAAATVTSFETVTVVPTQTMAPIRRPQMEGGTMKPVSMAVPPTPISSLPSPSSSSIALSLKSWTLPPISLPTPIASTTLLVNTIKVLPSSIPITASSWLTIVVPTPIVSIINTQKSSTATPSSSPASTPTPTPSESQSVEDTTSSTDNTCPATAVTKCCTSLDKVSDSLLTIVDDILPLLNLKNLVSDALSSTPVGLSCTDLEDDGVCEDVPSCCTEESFLGFDSVYESCVPLS